MSGEMSLEEWPIKPLGQHFSRKRNGTFLNYESCLKTTMRTVRNGRANHHHLVPVEKRQLTTR